MTDAGSGFDSESGVAHRPFEASTWLMKPLARIQRMGQNEEGRIEECV